ncbi:MAG: spore cortex biosynthesis protein YabQ [Oscillospiraceae bacterium]|nr:spore cortex biosynthesis protein YabQ [Candidatus Equicaccousia limihippi]
MNPSAQPTVFLFSLLLGAALCVCYDIIRLLKRGIKMHTAVVFALDILYALFAAIVTFCFMLVCSGGVIRWFIILGEIIGFVIFRVAFSPLFGFISKYFTFLCNFLKKYLKRCLKSLAKIRVIVYNQTRRYIRGSERREKYHIKSGNSYFCGLRRRQSCDTRKPTYRKRPHTFSKTRGTSKHQRTY